MLLARRASLTRSVRQGTRALFLSSLSTGVSRGVSHGAAMLIMDLLLWESLLPLWRPARPPQSRSLCHGKFMSIVIWAFSAFGFRCHTCPNLGINLALSVLASACCRVASACLICVKWAVEPKRNEMRRQARQVVVGDFGVANHLH